ncbi:mannitol dehydrogenase family protein [Jeotgalibaca porci]|uniref:mannitol dehydrogenase family protein n=1 Tax=Jeotgalibaca porci TaxID=1868793 RepID=UPI0035A0481C
MLLNQQELENKEQWTEAGIRVPTFDRGAVKRQTEMAPTWLHLGPGNIFRAFPAMLMQKLLDTNQVDTGIVVAEGYDYEIVDIMKQQNDNLSLLVTLKTDGNIEKTVVGSIMESLKIDRESKEDYQRLGAIFENKTLQMVSFTITEKGYSLTDSRGNYGQQIVEDFTNGPEVAESYIGKVAALLHCRFLAGQLPIAFVSMDNMSHNGDVLKSAIHTFASNWQENGLVTPEFVAYVNDPEKVSFPWSMIDKITPRPDETVAQMLRKDGFEEVDYKITQKNTYTAAFVNAEETEYLVIEDAFPNGRPPLDKVGVIFTDRHTVNQVETMKVTTCLNPIHTALAIFGCLLGYERISDEMKNPLLKKLAEKVGYQEGLPVVVDPGIINPKEFIDEVVGVRLPNPFIPDTPQRIATDTSQKLAIRFGKTIESYLNSDTYDVASLEAIPFVLAGWLRYLLGVDDTGKVFEKSSDPRMTEVSAFVKDIKIGDTTIDRLNLGALLKDKTIFGVDLVAVNMADKVLDLFEEMIASEGAVEKTLRKIVE